MPQQRPARGTGVASIHAAIQNLAGIHHGALTDAGTTPRDSATLPSVRIPGPECVLTLMQGDEAGLHGRLQTFARFLLIHLATRDLIRSLEGNTAHQPWAIGFGLCFLLSLHPTTFRPALWGALALGTWKFADIFPGNSNHFFLEYLCLLFMGLINWSRDDDRHSLIRALRWIPVLVLFWSGVNKIVYGTYFNGAFLASVIGQRGFESVFGMLLPAEELKTLLATTGRGPYQFSAWPGILASNAVYMGEILAASLLLIPRTRALGLAFALVVVAGIELGARELMFGLLVTNLLALFLAGRVGQRILLGSAAAYAILILGKIGLLPFESFN